MQLNRALAIAVVISIDIAGAARADSSFTSKVQVYADSDRTVVVSPVVQGTADVTSDTTVSLGYLVDAVTSASVDIVSQASPSTIHDIRHQASTSLAHDFGPLAVHTSYSYSKENDYLSHSVGLGASTELFDKNTTLAFDLGYSANAVGRGGDENFVRDLAVYRVAASWTQILSPRTVGQVTYELAYADGYQASPYRFVPIRSSPDAAPELWVPETDPETRTRHAIVVGVNHAVGAASSLQGDYRLYRDTWGITSHTIGARYFMPLTDKLELRIRERFYVQDGADFYQSTYTQPMTFIVFDRELSPLWSETLGIKLEYAITRHVEGELKLDAFYYAYSDFLPLTSRTGVNGGLGISIAY